MYQEYDTTTINVSNVCPNCGKPFWRIWPWGQTTSSFDTCDCKIVPVPITGPQPWICPRCGRVNGPYTDHCICMPPGV